MKINKFSEASQRTIRPNTPYSLTYQYVLRNFYELIEITKTANHRHFVHYLVKPAEPIS